MRLVYRPERSGVVKILIAHNFYWGPGGEDVSFQAEKRLLTEAGHKVLEYTRRNDEIVDDGFLTCAKLGLRTAWAHDTVKSLRAILVSERQIGRASCRERV